MNAHSVCLGPINNSSHEESVLAGAVISLISIIMVRLIVLLAGIIDDRLENMNCSTLPDCDRQLAIENKSITARPRCTATTSTTATAVLHISVLRRLPASSETSIKRLLPLVLPNWPTEWWIVLATGDPATEIGQTA